MRSLVDLLQARANRSLHRAEVAAQLAEEAAEEGRRLVALLGDGAQESWQFGIVRFAQDWSIRQAMRANRRGVRWLKVARFILRRIGG